MEGAIIMDGMPPSVDTMMMGMGMPNIASMIFQGAGPPPSMIPHEEPSGPDIYEEEIEEEEKEKVNEEEDKYSEIDDDLSTECSVSDEESDEESDLEEEEVTKKGVEGIKIIQGGGKVEEIKEVDRKSSIKELKNICQKMGISASGNKEQLIQRINSKK